MGKNIFGVLIVSLLLISCSKNNNNDAVTADSYLSITAGQTRTFENKDSISGTLTTVVQTSSNRDTTVGTRSYHVFDNSDGSKEYFALAGNDYYTLFNLPATLSTVPVELLYLKANGSVGTTWSQNFSFNVPGLPIPVPIVFTHTIKETGITKTTGIKNHTNVIRVETKITSPLLSINSDIQSYCAPKYGIVHMTTFIQVATAGINISTRRTMINANF
jgi:hypothetical protein